MTDKPKKCYVVTCHSWYDRWGESADYTVEGVFDTWDKADAFINTKKAGRKPNTKNQGADYKIEEHDLA